MDINNDGFTELKATKKQIKWYFYLMKQLGYTGDRAKEIIKKKFNLEHFSDISKETMSYVIDKLLSKK